MTRAQWFSRLFPSGVPRLWCPPLTHYAPDGAIDAARMEAHWKFLAPWVKGLLVPGSTGDGWELSEKEGQALLTLAFAKAEQLKLHLLAGALRPSAADARRAIHEVVQLAIATPPGAAQDDLFEEAGLCGFAVCPPRGANLSESEIEGALTQFLEEGVPLALYQLPQVTQNEMGAALLARLAARFPNFILFKDTSGADRVSQSGVDLGEVFLVRGAEGKYAESLKQLGGSYDGFLLSTANSFCKELHHLIELLDAKRADEAKQLSERLTKTVNELFQMVAGLTDGNAFANAGKAADHFFAHGRKAAHVAPPRLHAGSSLPTAIIQEAGRTLNRYGFMPEKGYLE